MREPGAARARIVLAGAVLIIAVILVAAFASLRGGTAEAPAFATPDLSNHPIYRDYEFGDHAGIVNFGIQPLWVPTNIIAEAIRRDLVLAEALADQGLELVLHPFLKGADVNFYLERGDLQVAIGGDMPALSAAAHSNALVASLVQFGMCSVVADAPMLMEDLRGRRIGYPFGSNSHYALLQALSSAGLQETDVHLVALDVNEMPGALDRGEIDAFAAWEPTPSNALARFEDQVVIRRSLCSGYMYFSRSFAGQHPEAVRQIVASQVRAMSWMREDEANLLRASRWALQAGQDLSGQAPVLSDRQYAALSRMDALDFSPAAAIPQGDLAPDGRLFREFEFLQALDMIPSTVEWQQVRACFDLDLVEPVIMDARRHQLDLYQYQPSGG
jgi:NitT/TauT family transport system substrate-binding protein